MSFDLRFIRSLPVRLILMLVIGTGLAGICGTGLANDGIRWESDIRTAANMAQSSNRLVLIHFSGDHCPPCRVMEKTVFPQQEVADAVHRTFVPVKIDTATNPEVVKDFQVKTIPADIVMTPDGRIVGIRNNEVEKNDIQGFMQFLHRRQFQDLIAQKAQEMQMANNQARSILIGPEMNQNRIAQAPPEQPHFELPPAPPAVYAEQQPPEIPAHGFIIPEVIEQPFPGNASEMTSLQTEQPQPEIREVQPPQPPALSHEPPRTHSAAPQPSMAHAFTSENIFEPWQPQLQPQPPIQTVNTVTENLPESAPQAPPVAPLLIERPQPAQPLAESVPEATEMPLGQLELSEYIQDSFEGFDNENFDRPELLGLSVEGFCPVELTDGDRWLRGDSRICLLKDNVVFVFSSEMAREKFLMSPKRYAPALSGCDLVEWNNEKTMVLGTRKHGVRYRETIYLFASKENLEKFFQEPEKYILE